MRRLLVLVAALVASVATSSPRSDKPDTGAWDSGTTDTGEWAWRWDASAEATIDTCDARVFAVVATLNDQCLATPEAYAWGYPTGSVQVSWTLGVEGETPTDTGGDTSGDTGWDDGGGPTFLTGDTGADTGVSVDTGADTGVSVDTGETRGDTGVDTGETSADTSGDTSADTGGDPSTDTSTDTSADTGGDSSGDTGDTCPASDGDVSVRVSVAGPDGEVLHEDVVSLQPGTPRSGSYTVEGPFVDCDADTTCQRTWTVTVEPEETGSVAAELEGELAVTACSSGVIDATSGALVVE
ncbi:MAG: hypothetical protein ACOZNI_15155 [Myxococcota bacterium]